MGHGCLPRADASVSRLKRCPGWGAVGWLLAAADPERRTLVTVISGGLRRSCGPSWSPVESGTCGCWEDDPGAAVWAAAQTPRAGGPAGPVGSGHSHGRLAGELRTRLSGPAPACTSVRRCWCLTVAPTVDTRVLAGHTPRRARAPRQLGARGLPPPPRCVFPVRPFGSAVAWGSLGRCWGREMDTGTQSADRCLRSKARDVTAWRCP